MAKEMIAMILAGGQGSRLYALTQKLAKPAVPFGGKYRIIDFPLSNCVNSGIDTVGILTQYQPLVLNEYIGNGQPWDLDRLYGGVHVLPPYQQAQGSAWYKGTANAIYQNLSFIKRYDPEYVIGLGVHDLHIGLPQRGYGPYILPVAAEMIGVHLAAVPQQIGYDIVSEVIGGVGISLILDQIFFQNIPVKDIDTHGCQIGLGILGFLLELCDLVVLIGHHQSETGGFIPGNLHDRYAELRAFFLMELQKIIVVLFTDLVTGENNHILRIIALNKYQKGESVWQKK